MKWSASHKLGPCSLEVERQDWKIEMLVRNSGSKDCSQSAAFRLTLMLSHYCQTLRLAYLTQLSDRLLLRLNRAIR